MNAAEWRTFVDRLRAELLMEWGRPIHDEVRIGQINMALVNALALMPDGAGAPDETLESQRREGALMRRRRLERLANGR